MVFPAVCVRFAEKRNMRNIIETAYEDLGFLACGPWRREGVKPALENVYDCLGKASAAFDNMVYERLGMSADELMDMLDADEVLP